MVIMHIVALPLRMNSKKINRIITANDKQQKIEQKNEKANGNTKQSTQENKKIRK